MKYCQHCGQEINDEAVVCIHCGCSTTSSNEDKKREIDKNSPGLNILSFLIPIVGLILYCINAQEKPLCAKGCGISALTGFILNLLLISFGGLI